MKNLLLIIGLIIFSFGYSQKSEIQQYSTNKRLFSKMLKKNGNVFELIAPGGEVSYIWTYSSNNIAIYTLVDRRKKSSKLYPLNSADSNWLMQKDFSQYKLLYNCRVVDGGALLFSILNKEENNKLVEKEFSTDIDCLKNTEFSSTFYKNLSNDIKKYKMGGQ